MSMYICTYMCMQADVFDCIYICMLEERAKVGSIYRGLQLAPWLSRCRISVHVGEVKGPTIVKPMEALV